MTHFLMRIDTERILHRGHQEQDSHNKKPPGIPGFQKTADPGTLHRASFKRGKHADPGQAAQGGCCAGSRTDNLQSDPCNLQGLGPVRF